MNLSISYLNFQASFPSAGFYRQRNICQVKKIVMVIYLPGGLTCRGFSESFTVVPETTG
jgi:hypothetical protein